MVYHVPRAVGLESLLACSPDISWPQKTWTFVRYHFLGLIFSWGPVYPGTPVTVCNFVSFTCGEAMLRSRLLLLIKPRTKTKVAARSLRSNCYTGWTHTGRCTRTTRVEFTLPKWDWNLNTFINETTQFDKSSYLCLNDRDRIMTGLTLGLRVAWLFFSFSISSAQIVSISGHTHTHT